MDDEDLDRLVGKLSTAQKVRLLTGATTWRTAAEPAVGLRPVVTSDGPAGVRGEAWDERSPSALLPSASAIGALWDEELTEELGGLLAREALRKGVDVVLAPTLNLHRTPLGGRHFECFSEDPELAGRTGAALVRGIQAHGVAATAKHYVANDSETDRLTVDVRVAERVLREVYLAPFEAAVAAGVWVVMAGYNGVNGTIMAASPLLADPLKTDWGFDGVVLSDWGAVRSVEAPARAALDLAMPGPHGPWAEGLLRAVEDGRVPEQAVDDKVRRLLRLAARVGSLDRPGPGSPPGPTDRTTATTLGPVADPAAGPSTDPATGPTPTPPPSAGPTPTPTSTPTPRPGPSAGPAGPAAPAAPAGSADPIAGPAARALLRRAVAAGSVLLHNRDLLPLDAERLSSLAVIGMHAAHPRPQGGGSARVFPDTVVTPLDGIRARLRGRAEVRHVPGPAAPAPPPPLGVDRCRDPATGHPGVLLRLLDADGRELAAERRLTGRVLEPELAPGAHTVEISALLTAETPGEWTFAVGGFGRMSLTVDGRPLLDGHYPRDVDDPAVVHVNPPRRTARTVLAAGRTVHLVARRELVPGSGRATTVSAAPPEPDPRDSLAAAVAAARACDAAIVVVGTTEHDETEGYDRTDLRLADPQNALVRAVAAANPRTAVVLNSGGPVELPWREEVGALLLAWFPGQEAGTGLADVLFGAAEPGGRLPTTWAASLADAPVTATRPADGRLAYAEGLHIGHRAWLRTGREPAYWFGHGLGYTTWEYDAVEAPREVRVGDDVTVRVRLRNTGRRSGREVVQLWLARPDSALDRPYRWFATHATVHAPPGARVTAALRIPARAFRYWSPEDTDWRTEPGRYEILVGRSAGDIRVRTATKVGSEA
ncbi:glycoside hydrolase family 3 C-terminal domain-containing protein [Streptomyces sp. NPDC047981]|uniref:glycoside hydrolase family 3 C-terminal domain-containing protein n=1 Tax=Streptomyces sp. NPDC047981 TaxID=3154610 RepID=UPI00343183C3